MLHHPTLDLLHELGLDGMAKGFRDLAANPEGRALDHAEWLGLLLEQRDDAAPAKALRGRARTAKLRHAAASRTSITGRRAASTARCSSSSPAATGSASIGIAASPGPCGVGKKLARLRARPQGMPGKPLRALPARPRLFAALALARGDGRYAKLLRQLARVELLILDDWGPEPLNAEQRRDLLEIVEDRYDTGSLIITSQVPIDRWYEIVGNPTLADAILDRIIHNAHRIELRGESLRKPRAGG